MTITTCAVLAKVSDSTGGAPIAGAVITAKLSFYEIDEGQGFVAPRSVIARTDANGEATLNLWPNELGSNSSYYAISIVSPLGSTLKAVAVVPNETTANLHDICTIDPYPGKPETYLQLGEIRSSISIVQQDVAARVRLVDQASGLSVRNSGFLASGTRASLVALQDVLMETISIERYDVKPSDGVTKTTDGFLRALSDLEDAGGGELWLTGLGGYKVQAGELAISGVPFCLRGKGVGMTWLVGVGGTGNILEISQDDYNDAVELSDFSVLTMGQETHSGIEVFGNAVDSQINRVQARFGARDLQFRGVDIAGHGLLRGLILNDVHNLGLQRIFGAGRRSANSRAGSTHMIAGVEMRGGPLSIPSDIFLQACRIFHAQHGFRSAGGLEGVNYVQCISVAVDNGYTSDNTGAGGRPWVSIDDSHAAAYKACVKLIQSPQSFVTNSIFYKREESESETVAISVTDSDLCKISGNLSYNASSGYVEHGDFIGIEIGGTSTGCTVDQNNADRVKYGVSLLGAAQNTTVRDNHAILQGSGTPKEYNNQSSGTGNRRIDNPQFETSARFTGADLVFGTALVGAIVIPIDTAELGDEYIITASIRALKDGTAGGIKATLEKTSGTAVPVFANTDGQAFGYSYLGASKDGYITIATTMKIATSGTLALLLSVATDAGQATLQANNAQISISRK